MKSRRIQIAVCTVHRDFPYVHQMLASLFTTGDAIYQFPPVQVMIGSPKFDYLNGYLSRPQLVFDAISEEQFQWMENWQVQQRMLYNYSRCLGMHLADADGLLVIEDDIIFRDSFFDLLNEALDEVEAEHNRYVFAAYNGFDPRLPIMQRRTNKLTVECPHLEYYGTQCCYFPSQIVREVWANLAVGGCYYERPADFMLSHLMMRLKIPICTPRLSLVQHIGEISTGCAAECHHSTTFDEPWILKDVDFAQPSGYIHS